MAHQDDSFWIAVFKKSPIIAGFMAVCGVIGGVAGGYFFSDLAQFFRAYLCVLISSTLGGLFVGLIIGVIVDSIVHMNRKDDDTRRRRKGGPWRD